MFKRSLFAWGVLILIVSAACQFMIGEDPPSPADPGEAQATPSASDGWYSIYFTDPQGPASQTLRGGPDQPLAEAIRQARVSVDAAMHQLDLWSIRNALIDAHRRGLQVRVVAESNYMDEAEMQDLIAAGIKVLGDRREGLMHDKFIVIDRAEVWTGSMNFSLTDTYRNNNALLRIRSQKLAQNYTTEFEEMFIGDHFGPDTQSNTPYPRFTIDGTPIEVFFSPDDGAAQRLVELVEGAQESIYFLAFSYTLDDLAQAMLERARAGVTVSGVFESSQVQSNSGSEYNHLLAAGLDVRKDGNPNNMHHKTILIDRKIVITGSFNFSYYADTRNDENLLVFYNPGMAAQFLQEFDQIFNQTKP
ncbi:MAG: hypothetical protein JXB15_08815 [Anaerolineales bacterium]|nr:hypothetical protein [Anaerolineales bacterium]